MGMTTSGLLTPSEAADQLNIGTRSVYDLIKAGKLAAFRGERGLMYVHLEDVQRALAESR